MLSSHWQSPTSSIVSPINCTCANLIHVVCQPSPGKRKAKQASSIQINHCIVYLLQGNDTIIARKSRHSSETLTITLHHVAGPVTEPDLKSGQSNSVGGVVGGASATTSATGAAGTTQPLPQGGALVVGVVGGVQGASILQLIPQRPGGGGL